MRLPEPVADYRDRRASGLFIFRRQEWAPEDGLHAEHIEIVCRCHHAPHALGFALAGKAQLGEVACRDACETLLPVAHSFDIRVCKPERVFPGLASRHRYHFVRVGKPRDWIEQGRIDPGENRGLGAYPEGEREDGNRCVARGFGYHSRAIPNVLPKRGHPPPPGTLWNDSKHVPAQSTVSSKRLLHQCLATWCGERTGVV